MQFYANARKRNLSELAFLRQIYCLVSLPTLLRRLEIFCFMLNDRIMISIASYGAP
jgi:hypothetical protein